MTLITENLSTYRIYISMRHRCSNKKNQRYGGRGIRVCNDWSTFEAFFVDMGAKPDGMSLDRKDNELGYSKENCRWATPKQNSRNTSRNKFYSIYGVSKCISEWSEVSGINKTTILLRIKRGWPIEAAVFMPTDKSKWAELMQPLMQQAGLSK